MVTRNDNPDEQLVDAAMRELFGDGSDEYIIHKQPFKGAKTSNLQPSIPKSIDHYRIVHRLGEGGMGSVYLADQLEPLQRRVAVKVIKAGMNSKSVLARFDAEKQALALMDHPNIASVYDASTTQDGRPYFVMEYVQGVYITEHCDRHKLNIDGRLRLFIDVCEGVQHAHQKGIIHRDIKPSNILVAHMNDNPVPKIIDFGVAKAVGGQLTDMTLVTSEGQLVGTPRYMSPEQAENTAQDIDTRSDIYSLGVLLYELLTGVPTVDVKSAAISRFDLRRMIREIDPPKPSTRLSDLSKSKDKDSTVVARNRGLDLYALTRELRGDLDWITMKCLEKDRVRRYATASELINDVKRHLENRPVAAGPPSTTYKLKKFVRRNRVVVIACVAVFMALVAGTVVSSIYAVRESRARRIAELEANKAHAALGFLQTIFDSPNPEVEGRDVRVVDVLEKASQDLNQGRINDPEVEAMVRTAIGASYLGLSQLDEAEIHLHKALDIQKRLFGENHPEVAKVLFHVARLALERNELAEASRIYQQCLDIQQTVDTGLNKERLAETTHYLGIVEQRRGHFKNAESFFQQSLGLSRVINPSGKLVAVNLNELARLCRYEGNYAESEKLLREVLKIYQHIHSEDHADIAQVMVDLGSTLKKNGTLAEAETFVHQAITIRKKLYGPDAPAVAQALVELSYIQSEQHNYIVAEKTLRDALKIYTRVYRDTDSCVANARLALAKLLDDADKCEESIPVFVKAIDTYKNKLGEESIYVGNARSLYGRCLTHLGRYEEAEQELLTAYKILLKDDKFGKNLSQKTASCLVDLYEIWGRQKKAKHWRTITDSSNTSVQE